ncbi:MAG: transglutaminase-like domain-containing protein, partial [Candidatus Thorarchaeota archaeon]
MSAAPTTKRKMGIMTILSTIFIVATLVWGTYSVMLIQFEEVRSHSPHEEYSEIAPWEYDINWAGGKSNWFDDINYTDLPLDQELPEDLLEHLEDIVFYVEPVDPPQLWRTGAYDYYDGSSWSKTISDELEATDVIMTQAEAIAQGNPIYTLYLNMTVGPNIGALDMPTLFPDIQLIEDSITSIPADSILSYDLTTDEYGTLRFWPLLQGDTGENVLISYDITFTNQDLISVAANSLNGSDASTDITALYGILDIELTTRVTDQTALFENVGTNAFEKAMAVQVYFNDNYDLLIDEENFTIRPPDGQEVTDWFIERGGGLPMDFATAYSVFMRDLGIPARITTGYGVGDIEGSYRAIKVKHMIFWVEVYIPLTTGGVGEWIQVIPFSIPPDMGGNELPANVDESGVEIILDRSPTWNYTGENITFYAMITVDDVPISTPEVISFYDTTDFVDMGSAIVDNFYATLEYTLPLNASSGFHNISATWVSDIYSVSNYTLISAVGQSTPLSASPNIQPPNFVPSATVDVNASIGLDNYVAYWNYIVSVYGILRVDGVPVNGDTLNNDQMEIWWDDSWFGNTTILSNGSYRLNILVDPSELVRMSAGSHTVRANYTGNWEGEFLTVAPGVSDDSTLEIHALVEFQGFTATPDPVFTSTNLTYDGFAVFLNGTALANQQIEIYLNTTLIGTTDPTTGSGGFNFEYTIPSDETPGIAYAYAYWTSPYSLVNDSISNIIPITIESEDSDITINSNPIYPDPVITATSMTIFGYLTDVGNGSGLVGKTVDLYWDNEAGAEVLLTSNTTITNGYYQFTVQVNASDEGLVYYRTYFNSPVITYPDAQSDTLNITIKKYYVEVSIQATPDPVRITESVLIQGFLEVPELGGNLVLQNVTIWWDNSTHAPFIIAANITTDMSGSYSFLYTVPFSHGLEIVQVYTSYSSPSDSFSSNESVHLPLQVINYDSLLSIDFNSTICHLNQTVYIYGLLQLDNGTPLDDYTVTVEWDYGNGTTYSWDINTNSSGYYNFYYNCTLGNDFEGVYTITVEHLPVSILYNAAFNWSTVTLQKYQFIALSDTTALLGTVHPDEVLVFTGNFTFEDNGSPLAYATIYIYYRAANGTEFVYPKITDSTGGFSFLYNYTMSDDLGGILIWARYNSSNALWADKNTTQWTLTLDNYALELTCETANANYFLDLSVLVYGQLTYPNGTSISGQLITLYWHDGTTQQMWSGLITNATGYFNYTYSLSAVDPEALVSVWATFNTSVNMWKNASSSDWDFNTWLYDFSLTTATNSSGGYFYLDQVVHVWGLLTFSHNGSFLENESITIHWNGDTYAGYKTNDSGYFHFYYNLSVPTDTVGLITIWAEFTNSIPLWDNADSLPGTSINLKLYEVTLDITISPNPVYLNGTLTIDVHLYFTNTTNIDLALVNLWWDNGNGTTVWIGSVNTNSSGMDTFYFSSMSFESILSTEIYGTYNGTLLIESKESSHEILTLQRWQTSISGFDTGSTSFFITDTVIISGTLYYVDGSVNYGGVWVEILVDGGQVDYVQTQSDGSFVGYWYIDGVTYPAGIYDITVRFTSQENWILSYETAPPITVSVSDLIVTWVFEITPNTTVYRDGALNITVILTLSNGSYYKNAEVLILFVNLAISSDYILFDNVTTDTMGRYSWIYTLSDTFPLGLNSFTAYCYKGAPVITEGWALPPIDITVEQIPVNLVAIGDLTVIYLGNTLTISGTLTFGNGETPIGHQIQIYWESSPGPII